MSDTQLYFAIGIPCFTIIVSLIISIINVAGIRQEMREIRADVRAMRSNFADDIRSIRATLDLMTGKLADLDTRVSLIEDRILGGGR
ncbi:MAG TPA: hypothetical protein VF283_01255 [Bryobacteraceae bacterium]